MRTVGVKQTQTDIAETRSCRQPSLYTMCVCVVYIRIHNRKERNEMAHREHRLKCGTLQNCVASYCVAPRESCTVCVYLYAQFVRVGDGDGTLIERRRRVSTILSVLHEQQQQRVERQWRSRVIGHVCEVLPITMPGDLGHVVQNLNCSWAVVSRK